MILIISEQSLFDCVDEQIVNVTMSRILIEIATEDMIPRGHIQRQMVSCV